MPISVGTLSKIVELKSVPGTGDALVELVAAALKSDAQALPQHAQARQALVEISAAFATKNIPIALALQERIKLLR